MHVRATGNNALKTKGALTGDALTLEFFTATLATRQSTALTQSKTTLS